MSLRETDFCAVCGDFTDVFRYRRHWLCGSCPKSAIDEKLDNDNEEERFVPIVIRVKTQKENKPKVNKKPKNIKPKPIREKKEKKQKRKQISCKDAVKLFFKNHPNVLFRSYELWGNFTNDYNLASVKNTLSQLVKDGFIFSRKINIGGSVKFSIYSTNSAKIKEFLEEENVCQIVKYVWENHPITTKKLAEIFPISAEAITKRLRKVEEIEIFQYMNRNFYFPKVKKEECIREIIQNTTWTNQWTN